MQQAEKRICVVEYGVGNIGSVLNACRRAGEDPTVVGSGQELEAADPTHILLPGVGAVGEALQMLRSRGFEDPLNRLAVERQTPLLGICVGMQLMAGTCEENGRHSGLGWFPATVEHLGATAGDLNVPHIGWNTIHVVDASSPVMADLDGEHFYFLHSYAMKCPEEYILCTTEYGGDFVSAVHRGRIWGVQFHPEKSTGAGVKLLRSFFDVS